MKSKYIDAHLEVARIYGQLSTATRLKVGCIIVKDDRIISIGYNGMPTGGSNVCEENGHTKPEVLHAETNAITKLAKSTESGQDAYMFCTFAPCIDCAKLILQSGIKEFHYEESYKNEDGINLLRKYSNVGIFKHQRELDFIEFTEKEYYDDEAENNG
jgi:dCMP deaminase